MLRHVVLSALFLAPLYSFGQTYYPIPFASSELLQSGIMLGTGHERDFSLRSQALGTDLGGIIEDQITDLYRNPAYFARMDSALMVGELVRPSGAKTYDSQQRIEPGLITTGPFYPSTPDQAAASTGLRYAYLAHFGILVRGNYSANRNETGNPYNGLNPVSLYGSSSISERGYSRDTRNTWGDIQLSYGWVPRKDLFAGVSYTFGLFETKYMYGDFYRSTSFQAGYRDTTWSHYGSDEGLTSNLRSHTFRLGLCWENPDNQIEVIGTVEALNGTTELGQNDYNETYDSYQYLPDTSRPYVNYRGTFETVQSAADVKGINVRLDFRYHRLLEEGRTFTAQLGGSVAHFSSDDNQANMSQYVSTSGQYTITGSSSLSEWTRTAPPDGFGVQLNASAGWTLPFDPFLIAAGGVVNATHLKYDYDAHAARGDTSGQIQGVRDSIVNMSGLTTVENHSNSVLMLRFAVPIAMEVEALKDFHIRAGWVPQYVRNVNKDDSNNNGFHNTSDNIDVSTMTFGIGYQILKKLRVDMVSYGDIAQPRSWNIAAQYTL